METGTESLDTGGLDTEVPTAACPQRKLYSGNKAWVVPRSAVWYHTMQYDDELPETVRKSWAAEKLLNVKP